MANVLIVAYLLIVLALIGVILLQRSEGGGLGMGGGGGGAGGLMTARGSANLLTRTTAILAALFMATAIALSILSGADRGSQGILDAASEQGAGSTSILEALDTLQGDDADITAPDVPATDTPAADEPAADVDSPDISVPDTGGDSAGN